MQALESRVQTDLGARFATNRNPQPSHTPDTLGIPSVSPSCSLNRPPSNPTSNSTPANIRNKLSARRLSENERDAGMDFADLRQLMRTALQTNNDAALIEVLQIGRDEVPDAIKTLQRSLERELERETVLSGRAPCPPDVGMVLATDLVNPVHNAGGGRRPSFPDHSGAENRELDKRPFAGHTVVQQSDSSVASGDTSRSDTLDREFLEYGIDALRRVNGSEKSLPSWTITK